MKLRKTRDLTRSFPACPGAWFDAYQAQDVDGLVVKRSFASSGQVSNTRDWTFPALYPSLFHRPFGQRLRR
jgi:hypothetical protein